MTKTCPSCDVLAPADARFCRHCGALLQRVSASSSAGGGNVSPIAATVPLSRQSPTDEIVADSAPSDFAAPPTSEVTPEEMYELWRSARAGDKKDKDAERVSNGQLAPTRDAQGAASSANQAERLLRATTSPDFPANDFDPEQTQITISVRPLTSRDLPADVAAADAAAGVTSAGIKPQFDSTPQQVTPSPTDALQPVTNATMAAAPPRPPAQSNEANEARAFRVWPGMGLAILSLVVICGVAVAAFWFGSRAWRTSPAPPPIAGDKTAPVSNDPEQMLNAKLAEADALIASGNTTEAVARLREAAALDPENAEPHRRLARLLLESGARREGIEALRVVTRLAPTDAEAWRSLAAAQFAEGLYEDALESYRGLGEASPDALARDTVQLSYADALRMSGRTGEARKIYRRLASSPDAEVAGASKQQLEESAPPPATDENFEGAEAQPVETGRAPARTEGLGRTSEASSAPRTSQPSVTRGEVTTPAASPDTFARSPSEHYQRGVALWATNRAAAVADFRVAAERGNADASYYLGLSLAEGRDPRTLKRAELVAALVYFGRARKSKFRAQSATYEEQLGRELDRRRSQ